MKLQVPPGSHETAVERLALQRAQKKLIVPWVCEAFSRVFLPIALSFSPTCSRSVNKDPPLLPTSTEWLLPLLSTNQSKSACERAGAFSCV